MTTKQKFEVKSESLCCSKCQMITMKNPIQCRNGHLICPRCCEKDTVRCPTCDVPMDPENVILCHPVVRTVLESIHLSCPFVKYGCSQEPVLMQDLRMHMAKCDFRKYCKSGKSEEKEAQEKVMEESMSNGIMFQTRNNGGSNPGPIAADSFTIQMDSEDSKGSSEDGKKSEDGNDADTELSNSRDGSEDDDGDKEEEKVEERVEQQGGTRDESRPSSVGSKTPRYVTRNMGKRRRYQGKSSPPPAKRTRFSGRASITANTKGKKTSSHFSGGLGDREYPKCSRCQKSFVNTNSLKKHLETIKCSKKPQEQDPANNEKNPKRCKFCGRNYSGKSSLLRHIVGVHDMGIEVNFGKPGIYCPFCHQKITTLEVLRAHITKSHQEELT